MKFAIIKTNVGEIKVELFTDKMPITTSNFIDLANSNFYDGIRFHRVINDFMIQTGDPLTKNVKLKSRWGTGGSKKIKDEFKHGLSNKKGTLAMANTGVPNSGSSQFFINLANNSYLDFDKKPFASKHPVFGNVISGFEVIEKISNFKVNRFDCPIEDIIIETILIME